MGMITANLPPGRELFAARDPVLGTIQVIETPTERGLYFGSSALQSGLIPSSPRTLVSRWKRQAALLAVLAEPRRVALLGLGGGELARWLVGHWPECYVEGVEISPTVVRVAQDWFALPEAMCVRIMDVREYLHRPPVLSLPFNVVVVDLHDGRGVSPACGEPFFWKKAINNILAPGGVLVFNCWPGLRPEAGLNSRRQLGEINDSLGGHWNILPVPGLTSWVWVGVMGPWESPPTPMVQNRLAALRERTGLDLREAWEAWVKGGKIE